jgi:IPTL-CTERM motif
MNRILAVLALFGLVTAAQATTYTYTGQPYSTGAISNFTPACVVGPCANYTGTMSISGSFTTTVPLPVNQPLIDISGLVTAYNFTDGVNTYSSSDVNVRRNAFQVATDSLGNISNTIIVLQIWETGTNPHLPVDRLSVIGIGLPVALAFNNFGCTTVGTPSLGDADSCTLPFQDLGTSGADAAGFWTPINFNFAPVPTLSERTMMLLAALMALGGFWALRRRGYC